MPCPSGELHRTPHIGYVEQDSYELYFRAAFENVVNFANGQPSNILN
jgi:D-3-phosphoglycerate dehydrogenase